MYSPLPTTAPPSDAGETNHYVVTGIDEQTGSKVSTTIAAASYQLARDLAVQRGIKVDDVRPFVPGDDDEGPASSAGPRRGDTAAGLNTMDGDHLQTLQRLSAAHTRKQVRKVQAQHERQQRALGLVAVAAVVAVLAVVTTSVVLRTLGHGPSEASAAATLQDTADEFDLLPADVRELLRGEAPRTGDPETDLPGAGAGAGAVDRRLRQIAAEHRLVLQATAPGRSPTAVLSGRTVGPGDTVDGLHVARIGDRWVLLQTPAGRYAALVMPRHEPRR
jgi:hypothetical protein